MKVLLETTGNRKGYKNFDRIEDFGDFMDKNGEKITKFQILEEDDINTIDSDLQAFANECKTLMMKIYNYWLNELHQDKRYSKLTQATQHLLNALANIETYILRGLIRCGITGKSCVCEVKKKTYTYITCYKADNNRMYIQEDVIMGELKAILNRIKLPEEIAKELQEDLKQSKKEEMSYCRQETAKLRNEQEKLKTQLDRLFDLMLDGELDKATFDIKRNEIQTKMSRIKNKMASYAKQDNAFRDIVQNMIDIAKDAGSAFTRSSDSELKRYLLKFVFKSITLTEGKLTYELNFPFELFEATNIKRIKKTASERVKGLENKGIEAKCNKKEESAQNASSEPQILLKNQGVRLKNPTPVSFGSEGEIRTLDTRIMIPLL